MSKTSRRRVFEIVFRLLIVPFAALRCFNLEMENAALMKINKINLKIAHWKIFAIESLSGLRKPSCYLNKSKAEVKQ